MTTFALLHGAWHDGWCWHLVVDELARRGHRAVAVDFPTEDPAAGASVCADLVVDALRGVAATDRGEGADGADGADGAGGGDGDRDVVVVAHSMGGLVAPIVAERWAVRRVVFVAGLLPLVGASFDDQVEMEGRGRIILPGLGRGQVDHGDGSTSWGDLDRAIARMCPDAPAALAREAAARLRRQHWTVMREVSPLRGWPEVDYASIVCAADGVVGAEWGRQAFRDRFHVQAMELPGDHSPFLSRPADLVDLLLS
jgi:alpha-beta hydrolase superfamily lysophospholipase